MKNKILFGFTLNEMLIAVAIVGIIAAVTVPVVVKNYQRKAQILALKKVYNELSQNLAVLETENYLKKGLYNSILATTQIPQRIADVPLFITRYYKLAKDCGDTPQPCFADEYSSIDSADTVAFDCNGNSVLLSNGTAMCITAGSSFWIYPSGSPAENVINPAVVHIDINGADEPNIGGRDMFTFNIYEDFSMDEVAPSAIENNTIIADREELFNENCLSSTIGTGCFAKILNDNWEMNY